MRVDTLVALASATLVMAATAAAQGGVAAPAGSGRPLTLGDAVRLAARNSIGPQGAQIRVAEAAARVRQQRAALLPTVSAAAVDLTRTFNTASFGLTLPGFPSNGFVPPPFRNIDLRARVVQPLIDPSAFGRVRAAQQQVTASSAEAAAVAEQAGTQAALAYVRALRAEDDLRARTQDSLLAAGLVGIARAQLQAGTGVALDVTRAEAQLAGTRAGLIAARAARDRTRLELARALNLPAGTPLLLGDSLAALGALDEPPESEEAAVRRALAARPDIRAAAARAAAARGVVGAIRAERLPALALAADDGVNGRTYGTLLNTYQYAVQLSVPLLDGFRREGRIQEQQGLAREAELQAQDLARQADTDVRAALLDLRAAREQVAATRERLRLSEQEVQQARDRFAAGVAGNADVITALLSLTIARTGVIDALTSFQAARIALARAEGAVTSLP